VGAQLAAAAPAYQTAALPARPVKYQQEPPPPVDPGVAPENVPAAPAMAPGAGCDQTGHAARAPGWGGDCSLPSCGCGNWFGGVAGLVLGRNKANGFWTSYETGNNPNQLL